MLYDQYFLQDRSEDENNDCQDEDDNEETLLRENDAAVSQSLREAEVATASKEAGTWSDFSFPNDN